MNDKKTNDQLYNDAIKELLSSEEGRQRLVAAMAGGAPRCQNNCSRCKNRGWWHNEFLDEVYCECSLGQKLKEEESNGKRREDK